MKFSLKITVYLSIVFILLTVLGGLILWNHQQKLILKQAESKAESLFRMILITRQWISDNRDRIEPVPAVATKELSLYANDMSDFSFHITSDRLMNPENAPDEFEKEAMFHFRQGFFSFNKVIKGKDTKVFRYMAPLFVNESCLKCHFYQNYEIGDLRGGISIKMPLDDIEQSMLKNNLYFIINTFIIFIIITLSFLFLMYKLVFKNLAVFKNAAGEITEGRYSVKTNLRTGDEFQELSQVFDMMSEKINKNEENLKDRLEELSKKYDHLLEDLHNKNKSLQQMSRFKTDIIDSVSHEVRTPLTKLLSYSDLMNQEQFFSDESIRTRSTDIIKRNIRLLKDLFDNVLTLSRLDHNQKIYPVPVNPGEIVKEYLNYYDTAIKDKQITISIDYGETKICVDVDSFQYAIRNLISNAVKYCDKDGDIVISCNHTDEIFRLVIKNTGPGILKDDLENIFSRFFRGENIKKTVPGAGLGLSIVKRIVEAHQGHIKVSSELKGWTEFAISLPLSASSTH